MAEHEHEWVELHRIDPEQSRPALGSIATKEDGTTEFKPKLGKDGSQAHGAKKYNEKVIVYYCECGTKKEEPWK